MKIKTSLDNNDSERLAKTNVLPFKLKKILVPMDFSDCSKKALQYAIPFAGQFNATIIFLNVIPQHSFFGRESNQIKLFDDAKLKQDTERRLAGLIVENIPDGITAEVEVRHGVESTEIVDVANKSEADLIIISTHGRTGRAHALIGSVAEDVVRRAPCPVLVVREHEHEFLQIQPETAA